MRYNVLTKNSTRAERIVYEILKELHISFRHRWKIDNLEIDFLVGRYAIEIDGHDQDEKKNLCIIELGYVPIHIRNKDILNNREFIKNNLQKL